MSTGQTLAEAFQSICLMDAPLSERLAAYSNTLRELNPPVAEAYDELVARLTAGEIGSSSPAVGDQMPPFILSSADGSLTSLTELISNGPIVLSFNRGHWCPFCKIELRTLAEHEAEIAGLGGRIVSIVPDRQAFVSGLRKDTHDRILMLSDMDNGYALSLGLAVWLGDKLKELMHSRGLHMNAYQGNDGWFVPLPATFVVGRSGRVLARHVDPEFRSRMGIEEILHALKSEGS